MKKRLFLAMMCLTCIACDRQGEKHTLTAHSEEENRDGDLHTDNSEYHDADNTERNKRDRDFRTITPTDQSESEIDRTITQKIRQSLVADSVLSTNAKNIKVITINGIVTLRGPVANAHEKESIARKVSQIQGVKKVDNQLEITRNP